MSPLVDGDELPGRTEPAFSGALTAEFERRLGGAPGSLAHALDALLLPPDRALRVPPATERSIWDAATGLVDRTTVDDLLGRAREDLHTPWPMPLASAAALVHRDGDRETWETAAFDRQERLSRAVVAAAVTGDEQWIDRVADGVVLLCEQSSWCWPAHDDSLRRHGAVLPTVTDPFLDLGAGEVVGQLAWIDQLLGAALDERWPGLRSRIRHEARVRVLVPFVRRRDWHWIGLDGDVHNWNPWIHGNVLVAALRLLDDPAESSDRVRVVQLAIEGLDRYVTSLPVDGAIDEGYSYWWNGACRALEALEVLSHATGGTLDATAAIPALREAVAFPHRMHLGGPWYVNVADGPARPPADQPWHELHRAARHVGDHAAEQHAAAHRGPGLPAASERSGLGRLLRGMTDPHWLAAAPAGSPLPRDVWMPSVQLLVAREHEASAQGLALAAKGGHNGEHHNHNDVGSFIVASDGVPVIVDPGRPTYTAATFGPDRYSIWTMQSAWHNVPEPGGTPQGAGAQFRAGGVQAVVADDATSLSLDLAPAYPAAGLVTWRRSVTLRRGPAAAVTIADAWEFDPAAPARASTIRLIVAGQVTPMRDGMRIVPLSGATPIRVRWDEDVPASMLVRRLDDHMLSDVWGTQLTRVELDVTHRRSAVVTVELDPDTDRDHR